MFELELTIYSVNECGEDLSTGEPYIGLYEGEDLYELKSQGNKFIIETMMKNEAKSGVCWVVSQFMQDGEYVDSDEWWCTVDLENKTVVCGISKHTVKFKFILKNGVTFDTIGTMNSEAYEKVKGIIKESFTNDCSGIIEFPCSVVRLSDCSVVDWEIVKTEVEEVL